MTDVLEMIAGVREAVVAKRAAEGSRVVKFRGCTEGVARDGGIVRVAGMRADNFLKNPVFMWAHGQQVVGRVVDIQVLPAEAAVDFDVEFAEPEVSQFADSCFRLVQADYLRAVSIGFQVKKFEQLTDEQRNELGLGAWGWVAAEWELHELSLVPVGADPDALKRSIAAGEIRQSDLIAVRKPSAAMQRLENALLPSEPEPQARDSSSPADAQPLALDPAALEALNDLTRALELTQGMLGELSGEIAGLRDFMAGGEENQENEENSAADSSPAHLEDEAAADGDDSAADDDEERATNEDGILERLRALEKKLGTKE